MEYIYGIIILISNVSVAVAVSLAFFNKQIVAFFLSFWALLTAQIVAISLLLSFAKLLAPLYYMVLSVFVFLAVFYWLKKQKRRIHFDFDIKSKIGEIKSDKILAFFVIGVIGLFVLNLIYALTIPVFNADSLNYHVPRVVQWLQNRQVGHYFTIDHRQTSFPLNSSMILMWTRMVGGGYWLLNISQWFSALVACTGIYAIAKQIGFSKKQAIFGAGIFFTMPMVILQSSTPQNDIVLTSFTLVAIYFLIEYVFNKQFIYLLISGLAFGIATGTKYTIAFAIPGVILYLLVIFIKNKHLFNFKLLFRICLVLIICFMIFGSFSYILNYTEYGNPVASEQVYDVHINKQEPLKSGVRYFFQLLDFTGIDGKVGAYISSGHAQVWDKTYEVLGMEKHPLELQGRGNGTFYYDKKPSNGYTGFGIWGFMMIFTTFFALFSKNYKKRSVALIVVIWFAIALTILNYTTFKIRYFVLPYALNCILFSGVFLDLDRKKLAFALKSILVIVALYVGFYASFQGHAHNASMVKMSPKEYYLMGYEPNTTQAYEYLDQHVADGSVVGVQVHSKRYMFDFSTYTVMSPERYIYIPNHYDPDKAIETFDLDYLVVKEDPEVIHPAHNRISDGWFLYQQEN
jgi:4-amino-4-deoxy-L-arabinose transferase-like glycosyltransferase